MRGEGVVGVLFGLFGFGFVCLGVFCLCIWFGLVGFCVWVCLGVFFVGFLFGFSSQEHSSDAASAGQASSQNLSQHLRAFCFALQKHNRFLV